MKKNILYLGLLLVGNAFGAEMTPEERRADLRKRYHKTMGEKAKSRKPGGQLHSKLRSGHEPTKELRSRDFCRLCLSERCQLSHDKAKTEKFTIIQAMRFLNKKQSGPLNILCKITDCKFCEEKYLGCSDHIDRHAEDHKKGLYSKVVASAGARAGAGGDGAGE